MSDLSYILTTREFKKKILVPESKEKGKKQKNTWFYSSTYSVAFYEIRVREVSTWMNTIVSHQITHALKLSNFLDYIDTDHFR
eukprot:snap_masked-scaffold_2-processed-gene-1.37-mRNA-1 protein AED:1.00 eAED:1.00 QI:0/0/0/0/1/1/2/0/82